MNKKKVILVLIGIAIIWLIIQGINSQINDFDYGGVIVFSEDNKLYSAQLDRSGKQLLATIKGASWLQVLSSYSGGKAILFIAQYIDGPHRVKQELYVYEKGKTIRIQEFLQKTIGDDLYGPESPEIISGTFGKNKSEVYLAVEEKHSQDPQDVIDHLYRLDCRSKRLIELEDLSIARGEMEYSKKLDALLFLLDEPNEKQQSKQVVDETSAYLFDMKTGRMKKLVNDCYSATWFEDGKKVLLYRNYRSEEDEGFYVYNTENAKISKLFQYSDYLDSSVLSPDKSFLLVVSYGYRYKPFGITIDLMSGWSSIISLKEGKVKELNWFRQYDVNVIPNDAIIVK